MNNTRKRGRLARRCSGEMAKGRAKGKVGKEKNREKERHENNNKTEEEKRQHQGCYVQQHLSLVLCGCCFRFCGVCGVEKKNRKWKKLW
jgi:hypothetical protein